MTSRLNILRPSGLLIAAACILASGCDSGNAPPLAVGEYSGVFNYTVDDVPLQEDWVFSISEISGGVITGTGMQGDDFVVVTGSHDHPEIILEFEAMNDGYLGRLTGQLSDDGSRIEGTFTLSIIFNLIPVTLVRTG